MKKVVRNLMFRMSFVLCFSCENTGQKSSNMSKQDSSSINSKTKKVLNCLPKIDTVFDGNAIKYFITDSCIKVKVSFKSGKDTILSECYDCQAATSFIPKLHNYKDDFIFLLMGHGFDYREFMVLHCFAGKIHVKNYETALNVDVKREVLVYQNYENGRELHFVYYKKGKERVVLLPEKFENGIITNCWFKENSFYVEKSDDDRPTKIEDFEIR